MLAGARLATAVVLLLLAVSLVVEAQQPTMPVIGFVRTSSIGAVPHMVAAFRQGLKDMGYVEGQNVAIEFRSADDDYNKLPAIIRELIRRPVAVLVANAGAARAAKAATTTVPVVFATGGDPVGENLVASFNRPGGNVTGVSFFAALGGKKLELIRALLSKPRTIAVIENPNSPVSQRERIEVETVAREVGQRVIVLSAGTEQDLEPAFTTLVREHAGALLVTGDALFTGRRDKLVALAARHAIPAIYSLREYVAAGGLMSYGTDIAHAYRQVGVYAGRILKGEKPADLPVVRPTKFELVINLKTAKILGLTIPQSVLQRADDVIE